MEGMKLDIYYSYPGVCSELDKKILKFFKGLGFESLGSGYNLEKSRRDLGFKYKGKK